MIRQAALIAGLITLIAIWTGPLPALARGSFAAHMLMHLGVVVVAAPMIAFGIAPWLRRWRFPLSVTALAAVASLVDLVIIWGWHTPLAHEAARTIALARAAEQLSFLLAGFFLWITVLGNDEGPARHVAGAGALLFTSMHMTLLGVLFSLMQSPICTIPGTTPVFGLDATGDQQLGGVVMLMAGGLAYLGAGLALVGKALAEPAAVSGGTR